MQTLEDQDTRYASLAIPPTTYRKFTTAQGPLPAVVIDLWQKIWKMQDDELGGSRAFVADFEIWDQRATNPAQGVVDIYLGIKPSC